MNDYAASTKTARHDFDISLEPGRRLLHDHNTTVRLYDSRQSIPCTGPALHCSKPTAVVSSSSVCEAWNIPRSAHAMPCHARRKEELNSRDQQDEGLVQEFRGLSTTAQQTTGNKRRQFSFPFSEMRSRWP